MRHKRGFQLLVIGVDVRIGRVILVGQGRLGYLVLFERHVPPESVLQPFPHCFLHFVFERASLRSWATFMLASWFAYVSSFFDNFVEQFMRAICGPERHGCILVH